jgi:Cu+-exporting ATPase
MKYTSCLTAALCTLLLLILSLALDLLHGSPIPFLSNPLCSALLQLAIFLPIIFVGRGFFQRGLQELRHLAPGPDLLIAAGASAAFILSLISISHYGSTGTYTIPLCFLPGGLLLTASLFERQLAADTMQPMQSAISSLTGLLPDQARLIDLEGEHSIPVARLKIGDNILIKAGEIVPADVIITHGQATIDESRLTGHPEPAERFISDKAYAGTTLRNGEIRCHVCALGDDRAIQRAQRLFTVNGTPILPEEVRTAARCAVYALIFFVVACCLCWYLAGAGLDFLVIVALSLICLISCTPFWLAAPLAKRRLAKQLAAKKVFCKDAHTIGTLSQLDTIVFSKTSGITTGQPGISDIVTEGITQEGLLGLAAAIEDGSSHRLAPIIIDAAQRRHARMQIVSAFNEIPGQGAEALLYGQAVRIGQRRWLQDEGVKISADLLTRADQLASRGKQIIYISAGKTCRGFLAFAAPLRQEAPAALAALQDLQISLILLTGDIKRTAKSLAKELPFARICAGLQPEDKEKEIQLLQAHGHTIAMLADGSSNQKALAQADMALTTGNSSIAAAADADLLILPDNLKLLAEAIELARQTEKNILRHLRQTFFITLLSLPIFLAILQIFDSAAYLPYFMISVISIDLLLCIL